MWESEKKNTGKKTDICEKLVSILLKNESQYLSATDALNSFRVLCYLNFKLISLTCKSTLFLRPLYCFWSFVSLFLSGSMQLELIMIN